MFKIAALKNIRNIFPDEFNPFYSGFGNRDTDAVSYRAVGISLTRIFIVNHDGEIHHFNSTYRKSYPLLTELVDDIFPSSPFGHLSSAVADPSSLDDHARKSLPPVPTPKPQSGLDQPLSSSSLIQKKITEDEDEEPRGEEEDEDSNRVVLKVAGDGKE
jgi:hypothetical protein